MRTLASLHCFALATAGFLLAVDASRGDEIAEKGRAILSKNQHAVVTVELVLKSSFSMPGAGSQSSENRQEVTGTVVDPSGLIVLSLSETDPSQMLAGLMGGAGDEDSKFKMESELSDVKILQEDGTEIPAEVVLRDKDLDLAFIRPKTKPATSSAAIDLSQNGKVDLLDQAISLNRLGNVAGRTFSASVLRIAAVVQRPRLYDIPEASGGVALGAPVFNLDGKILGILVTRILKGHSSGGLMGMLGGQNENTAVIIVTAEAIAKVAKQVPAAAEGKTREEEKTKVKD